MDALSSNLALNVVINLVLALVDLAVILALIFDNKKNPRPEFFGLMGWCVSLFGYLMAVCVSWVALGGETAQPTQQLLTVLHTAYDACAYVFYGYFLSELIKAKEPLAKWLQYALSYAYLLLMPLGLVAAMATENAVDTLFCDLAYFALVAAAVVRHRRALGLRALVLTCGIALAYALISLLQTWVFTPTAIVDTVVLLFVYWLFWNERSRELAQARSNQQLAELSNLLDKTRAEAAVSQIQPHFLFNSLAAIRPLCEKDPAQAQEAIGDFADYLRVNLESLSQSEPIPFEVELEHTQIYLRFEQLRAGDRLHVVYDIDETVFRLPTLTVQPLVENAVRHGALARREGGTVTLRAYGTDQGFVVEVHDDGPGFDPNALPHDGRAHVGLRNVRTRLSVAGGTLTLTSGPAGTTATIFVPR